MASARPTSTRSAGAGGSSNTMMSRSHRSLIEQELGRRGRCGGAGGVGDWEESIGMKIGVGDLKDLC